MPDGFAGFRAVLRHQATFSDYWPAFLEAADGIVPELWTSFQDAVQVESREGLLDAEAAAAEWLDEWGLAPADADLAAGVAEALALSRLGLREGAGDGPWAAQAHELRATYGMVRAILLRLPLIKFPEDPRLDPKIDPRQLELEKLVFQGPNYNPLLEDRKGFIDRWRKHAERVERYVEQQVGARWRSRRLRKPDPQRRSTALERDAEWTVRRTLLGETPGRIGCRYDESVEALGIADPLDVQDPARYVARRIRRFRKGMGLGGLLPGRPGKPPH